MSYDTAREFFEAAREASRDADRITRQLDALRERATSVGGSDFAPRVRSTPDPDRMGAAITTAMDHADLLMRRRDEDIRLMDAACTVLYGEGGRGGLWALAGWRADALWHHYLALLTWEQVGALLGYTAEHACREAMAALDMADSWGMLRTIEGIGTATD